MNVKLALTAAKPVMKKVVPVVIAAGFAAYQAITEQNAAANVADMEQRIKDLEKLFNK